MLLKPRGLFKFVSLLLCISFFLQQTGFAQVAGDLNIAGYMSNLRQALSQDKFRPLHLRYFSYNPKDNNFKILLDRGDVKNLNESTVEDTSKIVLKYFLVGVTLPNDTFWVNLRPDSPDNIIDNYLAQTDVGKIMLESDLQLKKDTAKFTSPQTPEGREYWNKLYQKAGELFGSGNITIPTLTRPWIVPGEIIISETNDSAYIYKASLKVMLEQDYLKGSMMYEFKDEKSKQLNEYSSQLIRKLILPKLTQEINTSKRYAPLRQVYYSLIMAQWFKSRFRGRGGLYASLIDQSNLQGLTANAPYSKNTYFAQYQKSFKDGEYNIQEPMQTPFGQSIRSYFSGGVEARNLLGEAAIIEQKRTGTPPNANLHLGATGVADSSLSPVPQVINIAIPSTPAQAQVGAPVSAAPAAAAYASASAGKQVRELMTPGVVVSLSPTSDDPALLRLETPDGSYVWVSYAGRALKGQEPSPTRGELYYVKVNGEERHGTGTSLALDALRQIQQRGARTVKMKGITVPGLALIEKLKRIGAISQDPVAQDEDGEFSEYFILPLTSTHPIPVASTSSPAGQAKQLEDARKAVNDALTDLKQRTGDYNINEGLTWTLQESKLTEAARGTYQGHGIAKGNLSMEISSLLDFLTKGIDQNRDFFTATIGNPGQAGRSVTASGVAVIVPARDGKNIRWVFVSDAIATPEAMQALQALNPNVEVRKFSDMAQTLNKAAAGAQAAKPQATGWSGVVSSLKKFFFGNDVELAEQLAKTIKDESLDEKVREDALSRLNSYIFAGFADLTNIEQALDKLAPYLESLVVKGSLKSLSFTQLIITSLGNAAYNGSKAAAISLGRIFGSESVNPEVRFWAFSALSSASNNENKTAAKAATDLVLLLGKLIPSIDKNSRPAAFRYLTDMTMKGDQLAADVLARVAVESEDIEIKKEAVSQLRSIESLGTEAGKIISKIALGKIGPVIGTASTPQPALAALDQEKAAIMARTERALGRSPTDEEFAVIWQAHLTEKEGEQGALGQPDRDRVYRNSTLSPETKFRKVRVLMEAKKAGTSERLFTDEQVRRLGDYGAMGRESPWLIGRGDKFLAPRLTQRVEEVLKPFAENEKDAAFKILHGFALVVAAMSRDLPDFGSGSFISQATENIASWANYFGDNRLEAAQIIASYLLNTLAEAKKQEGLKGFIDVPTIFSSMADFLGTIPGKFTLPREQIEALRAFRDVASGMKPQDILQHMINMTTALEMPLEKIGGNKAQAFKMLLTFIQQLANIGKPWADVDSFLYCVKCLTDKFAPEEASLAAKIAFESFYHLGQAGIDIGRRKAFLNITNLALAGSKTAAELQDNLEFIAGQLMSMRDAGVDRDIIAEALLNSVVLGFLSKSVSDKESLKRELVKLCEFINGLAKAGLSEEEIYHIFFAPVVEGLLREQSVANLEDLLVALKLLAEFTQKLGKEKQPTEFTLHAAEDILADLFRAAKASNIVTSRLSMSTIEDLFNARLYPTEEVLKFVLNAQNPAQAIQVLETELGKIAGGKWDAQNPLLRDLGYTFWLRHVAPSFFDKNYTARYILFLTHKEYREWLNKDIRGFSFLTDLVRDGRLKDYITFIKASEDANQDMHKRGTEMAGFFRSLEFNQDVVSRYGQDAIIKIMRNMRIRAEVALENLKLYKPLIEKYGLEEFANLLLMSDVMEKILSFDTSERLSLLGWLIDNVGRDDWSDVAENARRSITQLVDSLKLTLGQRVDFAEKLLAGIAKVTDQEQKNNLIMIFETVTNIGFTATLEQEIKAKGTRDGLLSYQRKVSAIAGKAPRLDNAQEINFYYSWLKSVGGYESMKYQEYMDRIKTIRDFLSNNPGFSSGVELWFTKGYRAFSISKQGVQFATDKVDKGKVNSHIDELFAVFQRLVNLEFIEDQQAEIDFIRDLYAYLKTNEARNKSPPLRQKIPVIKSSHIKEFYRRNPADLNLPLEQLISYIKSNTPHDILEAIFVNAFRNMQNLGQEKDPQQRAELERKYCVLLKDCMIADALTDEALVASLKSEQPKEQLGALSQIYTDRKTHLPSRTAVAVPKAVERLIGSQADPISEELANVRAVKTRDMETFEFVSAKFEGIFRGWPGKDCSKDMDVDKGYAFSRAAHPDTIYYLVVRNGKRIGYIGLMEAQTDAGKVLTIDTLQPVPVHLLADILRALEKEAKERGCIGIALPARSWIGKSFNYEEVRNAVLGLKEYKEGRAIKAVPVDQPRWQMFETAGLGRDEYNSIKFGDFILITMRQAATAAPAPAAGQAADLVHGMAQGVQAQVVGREDERKAGENLDDHVSRLQEKYGEHVDIEVVESEVDLKQRARAYEFNKDVGGGFGIGSSTGKGYLVVLRSAAEKDPTLVIHELTEALGRGAEGVATGGAATGEASTGSRQAGREKYLSALGRWVSGLFSLQARVDNLIRDYANADTAANRRKMINRLSATYKNNPEAVLSEFEKALDRNLHSQADVGDALFALSAFAKADKSGEVVTGLAPLLFDLLFNPPENISVATELLGRLNQQAMKFAGARGKVETQMVRYVKDLFSAQPNREARLYALRRMASLDAGLMVEALRQQFRRNPASALSDAAKQDLVQVLLYIYEADPKLLVRLADEIIVLSRENIPTISRDTYYLRDFDILTPLNQGMAWTDPGYSKKIFEGAPSTAAILTYLKAQLPSLAPSGSELSAAMVSISRTLNPVWRMYITSARELIIKSEAESDPQKKLALETEALDMLKMARLNRESADGGFSQYLDSLEAQQISDSAVTRMRNRGLNDAEIQMLSRDIRYAIEQIRYLEEERIGPNERVPFATWPGRLKALHTNTMGLLRQLQQQKKARGDDSALIIVDFGFGKDGAPTTFEFAEMLLAHGFTNFKIIGVDKEDNVKQANERRMTESPQVRETTSFIQGNFRLGNFGITNADMVIASNVFVRSLYTEAKQKEAMGLMQEALNDNGLLVVSLGPFEETSGAEARVFDKFGSEQEGKRITLSASEAPSQAVMQERERTVEARSLIDPAWREAYKKEIEEELNAAIAGVGEEGPLKDAARLAVKVARAVDSGTAKWVGRGYLLQKLVRWHDFTHFGQNTLEAIRELSSQGASPTVILLTVIAGLYHDVGYYKLGSNSRGSNKVNHEDRSDEFIKIFASELGIPTGYIELVRLIISGTKASVQPEFWDALEKAAREGNIEEVQRLAKDRDVGVKLDIRGPGDLETLLGCIEGARVLASVDIQDPRPNSTEFIPDLQIEFARNRQDLRDFLAAEGVDDSHLTSLIAIRATATAKPAQERLQIIRDTASAMGLLNPQIVAEAVDEYGKLIVGNDGAEQIRFTDGFNKGYAGLRVKKLGVWSRMNPGTRRNVEMNQRVVERMAREKIQQVTAADIARLRDEVASQSVVPAAEEAQRRAKAQEILGRAVTEEDWAIIQEAHNIGAGHSLGELRLDGSGRYEKNRYPAKAYTEEEIQKKGLILRKIPSITAEKVRDFIEFGVAGAQDSAAMSARQEHRFVSDAKKVWQLWSNDRGLNVMPGRQVVAEGSQEELFAAVDNVWKLVKPGRNQGVITDVIGLLLENVRQHAGNHGVLFVKFDEASSKVYVAVMDRAQKNIYGQYKDGQFVQREDSPGKGIALNEKIQRPEVEKLRFYTPEGIIFAIGDKDTQGEEGFEDLEGKGKGTLAFAVINIAEERDVRPAAQPYGPEFSVYISGFSERPLGTFEKAHQQNNDKLPEDSLAYLIFAINNYFADTLTDDASTYIALLQNLLDQERINDKQMENLENILHDILTQARVYHRKTQAYGLSQADTSAMEEAIKRCLQYEQPLLDFFDASLQKIPTISADTKVLVDTLTYMRSRAVDFFNELKERYALIQNPPGQVGQGPGGIDFRSMPITIKPMPGMAPGLSATASPAINTGVDKEWGEIENMLNGGIIPSIERIKELMAASTSAEDYSARIEKALSCIAGILRIEEDRCCGTDSALKQVLVLLESNKPQKELKLALAGIVVSEKEPQLVAQ